MKLGIIENGILFTYVGVQFIRMSGYLYIYMYIYIYIYIYI